MFGFLQGDHKKDLLCSRYSWRYFLTLVIETKVTCYHQEDEMMPKDCLGCYRVTTKRKKFNAICRPL